MDGRPGLDGKPGAAGPPGLRVLSATFYPNFKHIVFLGLTGEWLHAADALCRFFIVLQGDPGKQGDPGRDVSSIPPVCWFEIYNLHIFSISSQ